MTYTPEQTTELASTAYHAYGGVTDHKNYQGLPMPEWSALPSKIQEAWVAATTHVMRAMDCGAVDGLPLSAQVVCGTCGKPDPSTSMRPNPYAEEVNGDSTPEMLCDRCEHEAAMDI